MEFYVNCTEHNGKILVTGYKDGKRFSDSIRYEPYLFIPSKEDSPYKTITGKPVSKKTFPSIYDAKKFIRSFKDVDGFEVYGLDRFNYVYIRDKYKDQKYDTSLIKTCVIDIECDTEGGYPDLEMADKEITAITMMYDTITWVFGYVDFGTDDPSIKYFKCKNEYDLLNKFLKIWTSDNYRPDVVTGWNIELFDIPYIVRRITQVMGEEEAKQISPWGILNQRQFESFGKINTVYMPVGINILDYFALYKKFTYTEQESYKLDHIAEVELKEKKIDYSQYGNLNKLYKENPQLYFEYNIKDCTLVKKLDKKMRFLDLVYEFAYDSGTNFEDALRPVRSWDVIIHNHLLDHKKVIPQYMDDGQGGRAQGAHVKDIQTGMFDWVVSFDLASLYPHLIIQYNISPDTYRGMIHDHFSIEELLKKESIRVQEYLRTNNLAMAANGCLYTKDFQGFLPKLMQELFDKRKVYKKKMFEAEQEYEKNSSVEIENAIARFNNMQMAAKIKLNSCYGAMLNGGFRYYSKSFAESITIGGQLTIRWAAEHLNKYLDGLLKTTNFDYIIASDTDSVYINMGPLVSFSKLTDKDKIIRFLDSFCNKKIQGFLDQTYSELADLMNAYTQAMHMKREVIAERGIFVEKKRYAIYVWSNEEIFYSEPKLKIKGLEAVRSSTPYVCREAYKNALKVMLTGTEKDVIDYVNSFQQEFATLPFEDIASASTANGMNEYGDTTEIYKDRTPIHIRGSLLYNYHLKKLGVDKDYDLILNRDKIKWCYLNVPNPIREDVIAAPASLPKELGLDSYINYDLQFEKKFKEPISKVMTTIGWNLEKKSSLNKWLSN